MSEEAQSAEDQRPDFLVGDVIRLRSGGPGMTVEALPESGLVECVWFNNNADTAYRGTFRREILNNLGREQELKRRSEMEAWRMYREEAKRSAEIMKASEEQAKPHRSWAWTGR